jgi:hypothetical protein
VPAGVSSTPGCQLAASLGAYNDGAVTWDGDKPEVKLTGLDQSISIVRTPRLPAAEEKRS